MSFVLPTLPFHEAAPVLAVLVALVLIAPLLGARLRLPDVVVLILAGVVVGPYGLGLLERDGFVAVLGSAGLLVLMFLAGLELDLDDFLSTRRDSLRFGLLTFAIPLALGTAGALLVGLAVLPAVLIGSCWSSHTLLAYPQFRRAGTAGHRAVTTTVGATIITDTLALLVLVVVVRAFRGALTPAFWLTLVPSFALLVTATLWGLPRLARRFFAGPGQDGRMRLLFVLLSLFVVSAMTSVVGIEPIVGAFLAGLALNRSVPNGGALMERVEVMGSTIFVPVFLIATGMLVDLRVLLDPVVLLTGLLFAAIAMASKLLAAQLAGRIMGMRGVEILAMFSLSNAQAAATLAAVVVGVDAGLLQERTVNAVIVVILLTCVVASAAAERSAPRLPMVVRARPLGAAVVAPVANPASAGGLLRLASALARADAGLVVPMVVAPTGSDEQTRAARRALLAEVTTVAQSAGAEARGVLRIDSSPAEGIAHAVTEEDASLLVLGWVGRPGGHASRFGGIVDLVLARVQVPTLVVHDGTAPLRRIVVVLEEEAATRRGAAAVLVALQVASTLGRDRKLPIVVAVPQQAELEPGLVRRQVGVDPIVEVGALHEVLERLVQPGDVLIVPVLADPASLRWLVSRGLRGVPATVTTVVAVASGVGTSQDTWIDLTTTGLATNEFAINEFATDSQRTLGLDTSPRDTASHPET